MPTLDISEYIDTSHGNAIEPPIAHQSVPLGDEPTQSKPLHKMTRCVRIISSVTCLVGFGESQRSMLGAGKSELRIIQPGSGTTICAALIPGGHRQHDGSDLGSGAAFFEILTNPKRYKNLFENLVKVRDEASAARAHLSDLKAKDAALMKDRAALESSIAAQKGLLQETKHQLDAQRVELEAEKKEHAAALATLTKERAAFEQCRREHEDRLSDLERLKKVLAA